MKTIEKKRPVKALDSAFVPDASLDKLDSIDMFPKKTARAKARFKTIKLPASA